MPVSRRTRELRRPDVMRVLVACEWSNTVRDAFLRRGHDAYSCDLERADHPNPNWRRHVVGDVRPILWEPWDLVIAHPPCTYLCLSGVRWLHERPERLPLMVEAAEFFNHCLDANAPMVCVENPTMHGYAREYVTDDPSQAIQPWQFGETECKRTCLWLRGLKPLVPTEVIEKSRRFDSIHRMGSAGKKERARTFRGIAAAMAAQWG